MNHTYLAFDFGLRNIGVAVGQSLTGTANILPHLIAKNGIPQWNQIEKLIQEWKPSAIIVGAPIQLDGSEQLLTFCSRKFANRLREKFQIQVHNVDERLTTIEARDQLFKAGGFKALKKGKVDSMAAKLILEDWLRQHISYEQT